MHLYPNTQECRTEAIKRSLEEDKAAQNLWLDLKTYCTLEGDHFDWRSETTFIHHATLSHTATSDFKPSHPPTSSPEPPAFFSYKSSSSHRPVGADQGDTPPSNQQQVGNRERKREGKERKREEGAID